MDAVWDGIQRLKTLSDSAVAIRQALADAARAYDWSSVLSILGGNRELVNSARPGSSSLYAPLHQAAYGGAPPDVLAKLLDLGAWRTLQNARGERPVDVAERRHYPHLISVLTPVLNRRVPLGVLLKVQLHFHAVIRGRVEDQIREDDLRLPELEPLLEVDGRKFWFAVPGMYGGFSYWLETDGVEAKLVSESWSRVGGGSGQRHEITSAGSQLVAEGFV